MPTYEVDVNIRLNPIIQTVLVEAENEESAKEAAIKEAGDDLWDYDFISNLVIEADDPVEVSDEELE